MEADGETTVQQEESLSAVTTTPPLLARPFPQFPQELPQIRAPGQGSKLSPGSPTLVGETLSLEIINCIITAGLESVHPHKSRHLGG